MSIELIRFWQDVSLLVTPSQSSPGLIVAEAQISQRRTASRRADGKRMITTIFARSNVTIGVSKNTVVVTCEGGRWTSHPDALDDAWALAVGILSDPPPDPAIAAPLTMLAAAVLALSPSLRSRRSR
ncbi:MAG: hypothetical protein F8N39_05100 [Clostridiaceae bacterium]|nr:hypothetical protein [Clostridiaceae bacterium]